MSSSEVVTPATLARDVLACTACTARKECTRPTPAWPRQDPAFIMMIGRNPGINEDREGKPFVGRGGKVFQGWLNGLGLMREQVWLTNVLKCYTAADRKPKKAEIETCWNLHLQREIAYCRPHLICALGSEAFELTTGHTQLTYRHGIVYDQRDTLGAYVIGVIHPGSAMRSGSYMQMMVEDAKILAPILPIALSGQLLEAGLPAGVPVA